MKKTIQRIYVLLFCSLVLASACKKNELLPVNPPEDETMLQSSSVAVNGTNVAVIGEPNALLDISEPLFNEMIKGIHIEVVQSAPNTNYVAIDVVKKPGGVEPLDPCSRMYFDIEDYLNTNRASFVAWANQNCRPYTFIWKNPDCEKEVSVSVSPTELCGTVAYDIPVKVFDRL